MIELNWDHVDSLRGWLRDANGEDPHNRAIQLLKITEEFGEVAQAFALIDDGWTDKVAVELTADELCDVALTALVALGGFTLNPRGGYATHVYDGFPVRPVAGQIMYLAEQVGKVGRAYVGMIGQNPRKGVTHDRWDVVRALCDVVCTTFMVLRAFTRDPEQHFAEHLDKVAARSLSPATGVDESLSG